MIADTVIMVPYDPNPGPMTSTDWIVCGVILFAIVVGFAWLWWQNR